MQRAQATVLNTLTESRQFDKIKISQKVKEDKARTTVHQTTPQQPCRYCGGIYQPKQCPDYGKTCMECSKIGHFQKDCCSGRNGVVNKMEQEVSQEYTEDDIEMLSINLVCMNKNQSMLTAKLEMCVCSNNMMILYKINTGND